MPMPHYSLASSRIRHGLVVVVLVLAGCGGKSTQDHLAAGDAALAKGEVNAAVIHYKSALQANPGLSDARVSLGKALLRSGDPSAAALELARALTERAAPEKVLPSLAEALVESEQYKRLIQSYSEHELSDPSAQATLRTELARAWSAVSDLNKAEAQIAAALLARPDHAPAKLLRARLLAERGKLSEAVSLVDEVLTKEQSAPALHLRGELHVAMDDAAGADAAFKGAIAANPKHLQARGALFALALQKGDRAGAKKVADELKALSPSHPYTALTTAHLAFLEGDFKRAQELAQGLLRVLPDHQGVLLLAGAVESRLGAMAQSAALFGKLLSINPNHALAREALADLEVRLGQSSKALETLKPLLAPDQKRPRALALAGDAELRLGNPAAAEKHLRRAASLEPGNTQLQAAALMSRAGGIGGLSPIAELQALSERSKDTIAEEALVAMHLRRQEYDSALAALDRIVIKQPTNAGSYELRGRVQLAKRDFAAARGAFETALKVDPNYFAAVTSLVAMDLAEGRATQAKDRLQAIIKADSNNAPSLMLLAEVQTRTGADPQAVKSLLLAAVSAAPTSVEARVRLIDHALRKRQFKDALTHAQEALAALPGDVQLLEVVGGAQNAAGNFEQAQTTFRKLASAVPNSAVPYVRLAESYSLAGKPDQAEIALSKALEVEPDHASAQAAFVNVLLSSNRKDSAAQYVRRLRQARPDKPGGYALESVLKLRLKDHEGAIAVLREGLAKTSDPGLARRLVTTLDLAGKSGDAIRFGDSWLKRYPYDVAMDYVLATSELTSGKPDAAEERLKRVVEANPRNFAALNNLAYLIAQRGGKGAVQYAQRALEQAPDRPQFMDTLAIALAAERQFAQALIVQRRALELTPEDPYLRLNLARIALQAGDKTLAREELQKLEKLGDRLPEQADVAKLLRSL